MAENTNKIYNDIIEVHETSCEKETNAKLAQGWILLNTYTYWIEADHHSNVYVLGKPKGIA